MTSNDSVFWIDMHCHLDFDVFDSKLTDIVANARNGGVRGFLLPGVSRSSWTKVAEVAQRINGAKFALGLHPYYIEEHQMSDLLILSDWFSQRSSILAIGEIGLDKACPDWAKQVGLFESQLLLAKALSKPVIIHSRQAHSEILHLLKKHRFQNSAMIHGFSGSLELANSYWQKGVYLGVGGVLTYPSAVKTRKAISQMPLESLLLETDSPSMPIYQQPGEENEPVNMLRVIDALCSVRSESRECIQQTLYQNSCRFLGLDDWQLND